MNRHIWKKLRSFLILVAVVFSSAFSGLLCEEIELQSGTVAPEYVIGVEDVLNISVWKEEDLNREVVVRPDGKISFPLVNDITAAGLTCKELAVSIKKKLLYYIKEPNVTVIVQEINSFKVYVLGEVNKQGVFILRSPAQLLQVIAMSEGLNEYAKKTDIVIIRREADKERTINIDYRKIISGERPGDNIYMKPGDIIVVN